MPQHALAVSLSQLLLPLPRGLFIPFLTAFWTMMISEWSSIPALRMDKYLRLIRLYISATFEYLANHNWESDLVNSFISLVEQMPLSFDSKKVPDGLKYHILDVWIDGLEPIDIQGADVEDLLKPIKTLEKVGKTKVIRRRAREVLTDERLEAWSGNIDGQSSSGEEWDGFCD